MNLLHEPTPLKVSLLRPAAWFFYLVIGFEILFMISPLAFYFYAGYGPVLNLANHWSATAWLTQFFLPHIAKTHSAALNALTWTGGVFATLGAAVFMVAAAQLYWSKFTRRGPVTTGLYALSRHPQYAGLALLGLGTLLIWPRFMVLIAYVAMLFMYRALAALEERRCEGRFGDNYRDYQARTGLIPFTDSCRDVQATATAEGSGPSQIRYARALLFPVAAGVIAVFAAFGLREYALSQISAIYESHAAVLSPAPLSEDELASAYRVALGGAGVQQAIASIGKSPLVVHVVPEQWHLADLPMEIEHGKAGHLTPADFDRRYYKVLFSQALTHEPFAGGRDIVRSTYGIKPLRLVKVNIGTDQVESVDVPPAHVIWGDIPTPLF